MWCVNVCVDVCVHRKPFGIVTERYYFQDLFLTSPHVVLHMNVGTVKQSSRYIPNPVWRNWNIQGLYRIFNPILVFPDTDLIILFMYVSSRISRIKHGFFYLIHKTPHIGSYFMVALLSGWCYNLRILIVYQIELNSFIWVETIEREICMSFSSAGFTFQVHFDNIFTHKKKTKKLHIQYVYMSKDPFYTEKWQIFDYIVLQQFETLGIGSDLMRPIKYWSLYWKQVDIFEIGTIDNSINFRVP